MYPINFLCMVHLESCFVQMMQMRLPKTTYSQGFQRLMLISVSQLTSVTASLVVGSSQLILSQSSAERLRFAAKNSPINARTPAFALLRCFLRSLAG